MADASNQKPPGSAQARGPILSVVKTDPATFVDERTVKRALSALQRGPVRFRRDKVIACEGDAADFIFMVVDGVVRSSRMYRNGSRSIVAFYLPAIFSDGLIKNTHCQSKRRPTPWCCFSNATL